jgi:hypothetical protein
MLLLDVAVLQQPMLPRVVSLLCTSPSCNSLHVNDLMQPELHLDVSVLQQFVLPLAMPVLHQLVQQHLLPLDVSVQQQPMLPFGRVFPKADSAAFVHIRPATACM